jgi:hypothetical protein
MLLKKPPEFWTNKPLGNPGRFRRAFDIDARHFPTEELEEAKSWLVG